MQVQVEYFLSALFPYMELQLIPGNAVLFGERLRLTNEQTGHMRRGLREIIDGRHEVAVLLGDEEQMRGYFGMDILERHHFVILENDSGGDFLVTDLMEKSAFWHGRNGKTS